MRSRCRGSREIPSLTCSGVTERAPGELGVGSRPLARAHGHLSPSPTLCGYTGIMSTCGRRPAPSTPPTSHPWLNPKMDTFRGTELRGSPNPGCYVSNQWKKKKKIASMERCLFFQLAKLQGITFK